MYKCGECGGSRVSEKIQTYPDRKVLTLTYQDGCIMVLESKGTWVILNKECNFKFKKRRG